MLTTTGRAADGDASRAAGFAPGRRRLGIVAVLAVVVVMAGAAAWRWWPSPSDAFYPSGGAGQAESATAGETYFFDTGVSALRAVMVRSVVPVLDKDSAPVAVGIVVCDPGGVHFFGTGNLKGCPNPRTVRTVRVMPDPSHSTWFVVAVTPLTSGVVHIDGFKVTYADHGSRTVLAGIDIKINAHVP